MRLGRDVQAGSRLVEDDEPGPVREGHREPDPLLLAAGELMRVTLEEAAVVGERDLAHHLRDALGVIAAPAAVVRLEYLHELEADPQRRVQRRGRVLGNVGDDRAPQLAALLLAERQDVVVTQPHRPARDPQAAPGVAEQRQADCGLAGPGLAHEPEDLARRDPERHVADDRRAGRGDLDLQALDGIASTELQGIKSDSKLRIAKQTGLGYQGLTLNLGNKNGLGKLPYSNVGTPIASNANLRKAFEEAIDRKAMNKVVFGGTVLPGCTPISPSSVWYDPSVKCTPFNPTDAKKLVAASGVSNPTVHLMVPTGTVALRQAQFLQSEEKTVGINVVIDSTDFVTSLSKADAGTYETFQIGWSGRVDPDGNIFSFVATAGS